MASLLPGAMAGLIVVVMSVSLCSLIFQGKLAQFLEPGLRLALISCTVVGTAFAAFGSSLTSIAMPDEDTIPILAVIVAAVAASAPGDATPAALFSLVVITIVASTLSVGTGLFLLGAARAGRLLEFLPHSVIGGYLAAVGWLIFKGSVEMAAEPILASGASSIDAVLAERATWGLVLPSLLLAASVAAIRLRVSRFETLPWILAGSAALFFLALALTGITLDEALLSSLLIGSGTPVFEEAPTTVLALDFSAFSLTELPQHIPSYGTIVLLSLVSLTLCLSTLSVLTGTECDMDRELKVAGLSNLVSGFFGGMSALPSITAGKLAIDLGSPASRWTGLIAALVCLAVLALAMHLVQYIPRFLVLGLLMYLGLALLKEWLVAAVSQFSLAEYLVIPTILLVSVFGDFLQAILLGTVAAIVLFVVKYSSVDPVRFVTTGSDIASNVDRRAGERELLTAHGYLTLVISLHGYLFFGTAGQVYRQVVDRLKVGPPGPEYLVLDFSHVTGIDSSAAINFRRILNAASSQGVTLILSGIDATLLERLSTAGTASIDPDDVVVVPDLDRGIEFCERQIIGATRETLQREGCFERLGAYLSRPELETFKSYLSGRMVEAGEILARQGDQSTELYFLESSSASVYVESPSGESARVRLSEAGTVFGELSFYMNSQRSATVMADQAGMVYVLEVESMERMEREHPEIAADFHHFMAQLLSERLLFTTRTLNSVML